MHFIANHAAPVIRALLAEKVRYKAEHVRLQVEGFSPSEGDERRGGPCSLC